MSNLATLAESEVRPFSSGEALHASVDTLPLEDRTLYYKMLKWVREKIEDRLGELNERIKEDVRQVGITNEKGHTRFEHNGTISTVEKRVSKSPDEKALNKLLTANGIAVTSVYDKIQVEQLNLSKVNDLVDKGKLKQADVDALFKVTFALTVEPSQADLKILEATVHGFEAEKKALASKK